MTTTITRNGQRGYSARSFGHEVRLNGAASLGWAASKLPRCCCCLKRKQNPPRPARCLCWYQFPSRQRDGSSATYTREEMRCRDCAERFAASFGVEMPAEPAGVQETE